MNKEVESKASRHHDLIQEQNKKEQIKNRGDSKFEAKKKKIEQDEKRKQMLKLNLEQSNSVSSPTNLVDNVSNLKKMKRRNNTEKVEKEVNISNDDNDTIDDKESYQSNLKEMIDKLNDLKYKTNEWQKTNENIVDYGDSYMRKKRTEKERSKERTDSLVKGGKQSVLQESKKVQRGRDANGSEDKSRDKSADSIKLDKSKSRSESPDIIKNYENQSSIISETQMIYSEDMNHGQNKSSSFMNNN